MQQETQLTLGQLQEMRGSAVHASDGTKIGSVEEIFCDVATDTPEWIGIGTGFLGTKRVLVPTLGAKPENGGLTVPYPKQKVKDAPTIDGNEVNEKTESELYSHYGLSYSTQSSPTGLPESGWKSSGGGEPKDQGLSPGKKDSPGDKEGGQPSLVRSEEELKVGKRQVEAGSVRLKKVVDTEDASLDVDLKRETAKVTREPMNEPMEGTEIGEENVEMPLHKEEAVVQKQVVGKETVKIEKGAETETQQVTDTVRKERVEVENKQ